MVSKTRGPPEPESLLTWLVIHCLDSSKCVVSETRIAHQFHVFFPPERYKNCPWQSCFLPNQDELNILSKSGILVCTKLKIIGSFSFRVDD